MTGQYLELSREGNGLEGFDEEQAREEYDGLLIPAGNEVFSGTRLMVKVPWADIGRSGSVRVVETDTKIDMESINTVLDSIEEANE